MSEFNYSLVKRTTDYALTIDGNTISGIDHDTACHFIHRAATERIYLLLEKYYKIVLEHVWEANQDRWRELSDKYKKYVANEYPYYMVRGQMTIERLELLLPSLPTPRDKAQKVLDTISQLYGYMDSKTDHRQSLSPLSAAA